MFPTLPLKLTDLFIRYVAKANLPRDITFHCLRDTYISRLAEHVSTPTLMALARHRDYRTTRRYVQVDGDHLRVAVEQLAEARCHADAGLVDSFLASVKREEETA